MSAFKTIDFIVSAGSHDYQLRLDRNNPDNQGTREDFKGSERETTLLGRIASFLSRSAEDIETYQAAKEEFIAAITEEYGISTGRYIRAMINRRLDRQSPLTTFRAKNLLALAVSFKEAQREEVKKRLEAICAGKLEADLLGEQGEKTLWSLWASRQTRRLVQKAKHTLIVSYYRRENHAWDVPNNTVLTRELQKEIDETVLPLRRCQKQLQDIEAILRALQTDSKHVFLQEEIDIFCDAMLAAEEQGQPLTVENYQEALMAFVRLREEIDHQFETGTEKQRRKLLAQHFSYAMAAGEGPVLNKVREIKEALKRWEQFTQKITEIEAGTSISQAIQQKFANREVPCSQKDPEETLWIRGHIDCLHAEIIAELFYSQSEDKEVLEADLRPQIEQLVERRTQCLISCIEQANQLSTATHQPFKSQQELDILLSAFQKAHPEEEGFEIRCRNIYGVFHKTREEIENLYGEDLDPEAAVQLLNATFDCEMAEQVLALIKAEDADGDDCYFYSFEDLFKKRLDQTRSLQGKLEFFQNLYPEDFADLTRRLIHIQYHGEAGTPSISRLLYFVQSVYEEISEGGEVTADRQAYSQFAKAIHSKCFQAYITFLIDGKNYRVFQKCCQGAPPQHSPEDL